MAFLDYVRRREVRRFGKPEIVLKIYDSFGDDTNLDALLGYLEQARINESAFAGVGHIVDVPNHGPTGFVQVYGRGNLKVPESVYPMSINLATGENSMPLLGAACIEETVVFGKEAEMFLELGLDEWIRKFAL
jgi:hypothetical protein